jgi:hypothetical protein
LLEDSVERLVVQHPFLTAAAEGTFAITCLTLLVTLGVMLAALWLWLRFRRLR